jgi:hypothetical protein
MTPARHRLNAVTNQWQLSITSFQALSELREAVQQGADASLNSESRLRGSVETRGRFHFEEHE